MLINSRQGLALATIAALVCLSDTATAQDVNRRTVKTFSEYRSEEQARMFEWYGVGRPALIEPAAGPTGDYGYGPESRQAAMQRRSRWNDDVGIKRYVPRLGSPERPYIMRVEPEGSSLPLGRSVR